MCARPLRCIYCCLEIKGTRVDPRKLDAFDPGLVVSPRNRRLVPAMSLFFVSNGTENSRKRELPTFETCTLTSDAAAESPLKTLQGHVEHMDLSGPHASDDAEYKEVQKILNGYTDNLYWQPILCRNMLKDESKKLAVFGMGSPSARSQYRVCIAHSFSQDKKCHFILGVLVYIIPERHENKVHIELLCCRPEGVGGKLLDYACAQIELDPNIVRISASYTQDTSHTTQLYIDRGFKLSGGGSSYIKKIERAVKVCTLNPNDNDETNLNTLKDHVKHMVLSGPYTKDNQEYEEVQKILSRNPPEFDWQPILCRKTLAGLSLTVADNMNKNLWRHEVCIAHSFSRDKKCHFILGVLVYRIRHKNEVRIDLLCCGPRGVGSKLIDYACARIQQLKSNIEIITLLSDVDAKWFYEYKGFKSDDNSNEYTKILKPQ